MLHVNRRNGFTIAVSENKHIAPISPSYNRKLWMAV
jgi:hypothetical protein